MSKRTVLSIFALVVALYWNQSFVHAQSTTPGLIWSQHSGVIPMGPEQWQGEAVSIGNFGAQSISGHVVTSSFSRIRSSYDISPPQVLQQLDAGRESWDVKVASASSTDLHAYLYSRNVPGNSTLQEVQLRLASLSNPQRNWTYTFPNYASSYNLKNYVDISRTGNRIIAVMTTQTGVVDIRAFSPDSATPIGTTTLTNIMPLTAVDLSADGTTMVAIADHSTRVIDVPSMNVLYSSTPSSSTFQGLAISGDGGVFAIGRIGRVDIFRRVTSGQYVYSFTSYLSGTNYCNRLAISEDGSTLVTGYNFHDMNRTVVVQSIDLNTQAVLMSKSFTSSVMTNVIYGLSVSANGEVIAVGISGDLATGPNAIPQLYFFRRDSDIAIAEHLLSGSVIDLELSADGKQCIVGTKDGHSSLFTQSAGEIDLFQVLPQDIAVHGVPHASGQIQIELKGTPGRNATVLMSHSLATNPQTFPQMGTLHLNRADISVISAGTFDAQGRATATITLPGTVGTELFFQKLETGNLQPRRLGEDFVKVQTF